MQELVQAASVEKAQPVPDLKKTLYHNAQIALQSVEALGIEQVQHLIPLPPFFEMPQAAQPAATMEAMAALDKMDFRLRILRELAHLLSKDFDLNTVLSAVMEGLYRALPLDRVVFAWITSKSGSNKHPDAHGVAHGPMLVAKSVLGPHQDLMMRRFHFPIYRDDPRAGYSAQAAHTLIDYLLASDRALWIDRKKRHDLQYMMTPAIQACIGYHPFFAMPIAISGQTQGLVYGDRSLSGEPFDSETFLLFQHYCEHISIAFKLLTAR
jgi:hypothetical protein